jgi:hypothetical protein
MCVDAGVFGVWWQGEGCWSASSPLSRQEVESAPANSKSALRTSLAKGTLVLCVPTCGAAAAAERTIAAVVRKHARESSSVGIGVLRRPWSGPEQPNERREHKRSAAGDCDRARTQREAGDAGDAGVWWVSEAPLDAVRKRSGRTDNNNVHGAARVAAEAANLNSSSGLPLSSALLQTVSRLTRGVQPTPLVKSPGARELQVGARTDGVKRWGATTTNGAAKARSRTVGVFEIGEKERSELKSS